MKIFTIQYRNKNEMKEREYIKKIFTNAREALVESYRINYNNVTGADQRALDRDLEIAYNNSGFKQGIFYNCDEIEFHLDYTWLSPKQKQQYKWLTDQNINVGLYWYKHDDKEWICGFKNVHFFMIEKQPWMEYALTFYDSPSLYNDYVQVENMFAKLKSNYREIRAIANQLVHENEMKAIEALNISKIEAYKYEASINNSMFKTVYWNWASKDNIIIPTSVLKHAASYTNYEYLRVGLIEFGDKHMIVAQSHTTDTKDNIYVFARPLTGSYTKSVDNENT